MYCLFFCTFYYCIDYIYLFLFFTALQYLLIFLFCSLFSVCRKLFFYFALIFIIAVFIFFFILHYFSCVCRKYVFCFALHYYSAFAASFYFLLLQCLFIYFILHFSLLRCLFKIFTLLYIIAVFSGFAESLFLFCNIFIIAVHIYIFHIALFFIIAVFLVFAESCKFNNLYFNAKKIRLTRLKYQRFKAPEHRCFSTELQNRRSLWNVNVLQWAQSRSDVDIDCKSAGLWFCLNIDMYECVC